MAKGWDIGLQKEYPCATPILGVMGIDSIYILVIIVRSIPIEYININHNLS
jgi:hypothetical protein